MPKLFERQNGYMIVNEVQIVYWGQSIHVARLIAHVMQLNVT